METREDGRRGWLFVFEGIDGSGKTTQLRRVGEELRRRGLPVLERFEPTRGEFGRRIRASAQSEGDRLAPEEELELFIRDREENVEANIRPALERGDIILLDRYYFSTAAYQGARGLDPEAILRRNKGFAPRPDLVFYFQIGIEEALARIERSRGGVTDGFERADYLRRVKAIFDEMAGRLEAIRTVDATRDEAEITREIIDMIEKTLQARSSHD